MNRFLLRYVGGRVAFPVIGTRYLTPSLSHQCLVTRGAATAGRARADPQRRVSLRLRRQKQLYHHKIFFHLVLFMILYTEKYMKIARTHGFAPRLRHRPLRQAWTYAYRTEPFDVDRWSDATDSCFGTDQSNRTLFNSR